ncbi:MAG: hypothetical protein M0Z78_05340 [Betaproteobacteria bacterium]|nr:hypothetical protein [Betaproteobacteria bacterium]
MANGWTPERRARQAELIRTWKPWTRSTGPQTPEGKIASSKNRQLSLDRARQDIERAEEGLQLAKKKLARLKGR